MLLVNCSLCFASFILFRRERERALAWLWQCQQIRRPRFLTRLIYCDIVAFDFSLLLVSILPQVFQICAYWAHVCVCVFMLA